MSFGALPMSAYWLLPAAMAGRGVMALGSRPRHASRLAPFGVMRVLQARRELAATPASTLARRDDAKPGAKGS